MYQIKCDDCILLDLRSEDLILTNPKVNNEVNTVCEASFVIYDTHPYFQELKLMKSIFEVSDEVGVIFRGRMTNHTKDFYNCKAVDLEGVMAFFNDSIVRPFDFPNDFSDATGSSNIVEYFLNWLIENHNSQVQDFQKFKLGKVTVADPNNYIVRTSDAIQSSWEIISDKLFNSSLGGYLCIRYEDDGNYIDYLSEFTETNAQPIKFGENLLDLSRKISAENTFSAIIPYGATIEEESTDTNGDSSTTSYKLTLESLDDGPITTDIYKSGDTLYSKEAVEKYGWIYAPVDETTWDDVAEVQNLKAKAVEYMEGVAVMLADTLELSAADLHFTDKQIASFRIGKNVRVKSEPHDIDISYKLTRLEIDILNPQNTKIVVGETKKTLTESVGKVKDGLPGENGVDGKTYYLHIKYSDDGGKTFTANNGETTGRYIGVYTDTTQADSTEVSSYTWLLIKGDDGDDGVGVSSIMTQFYLSTSKTEQQNGSWVADMPTWSSGKYLWTRSVITYSDGTIKYTSPICDSSWEAVNEVKPDIEDAKKYATGFIDYDELNNRLVLGYKLEGYFVGTRTQLTPSALNIIDASGRTIASYETNKIDLGIASKDAIINLCGGVGTISVEDFDSTMDRMKLHSRNLYLYTQNADGIIGSGLDLQNKTNGQLSGASLKAVSAGGASAELSLTAMLGSTAFASLALETTDGAVTYSFGTGTNGFKAPAGISTTDIYASGDIIATNILGTASKAIADEEGNNIVNTYATKSEVSAAAGGNYLPLSGGTMTDSIDMSIQGKGYYLRDTEGRFPGVLQNTSGNLWVGGASTASRHHLGKTFISAGYNAEESGGYGTIWIFVPNTSNNGGTSHQVLHEGNFGTWAAAAGHTHADYALITHTHSNYAASGHNHDDRYFTESEINTVLNKKANDYSIEIYNGTGGNPKPVRFMSVDYSTCGSENGVAVKVGLVSGHGNGSSYAFLEDAIIKVRYDGIVEVENFKYYGADTGTYDGANRQYGDIFWVIDTTNKIVDFYVLMGQYARLQMTPAKRVTYSTGGTITQYNSCTVYSSGTKAWGNNSVIVLSRELSNYADIGHTHNYLPLTGGVMSGEIKIGQGDGNGIQLGTDGRINATVGTTTTATVSGVINNQYISGHTSLNLTLRGNATRPSYNGNQVALLSDINTIDLSGYLPLTGGLMTGSIRFQSSSLPQKSLKYICGIDAFADGGELGWQSKDEFLSGYSKDGHSHDDWYAGINHTHTEYSPAGHVHPEYAEKEHTHSAYAALNHDHGGTYAKVAAANTYNGEQKFQNSSYCPTVLDTASGVGCAFKASRGLVNELLVDDIIMTASSGEIAFYMYEATDGAGQMKILTKVASIDKTGLYKGTAEKATADGAGNAITTTYATKAQLSGYAAAGHSHNSITYQDTRSANQTPADLSAGLSVHLKSNGIDGISDGGNYHPVLALKPWRDISGGPYGQITTTQNGNLYWRVSTANNDTSWNGWQKAAPTIAPADISGTETITAKFGTSNGGAIIFGKEGPNSGTMIRIDQTDGTCRLRFRASDTAGAMVWEQPEQGAQLYIDLGKEGSDKHRITFPSSAGTLALTSHTHSYLPLSGGTLTGTLIAPVYKCDTTAAAIKPSDSNEINFGSNANYIYFGYQNRIGSDGAVANYYFGTHSGPDGAKSGNIYCGTLYEGNVALSDKYAVKGHTHSQYVSFSTCLDVSVAGATKLVYRYRPPDYDDDTGVSSGSAYFPEGIIMGGTAASAGLMARGICGISTPDPDSGACAKENLYINYDGDNTYRNTRHLILQAGSAGTHYGNNVYQYAAVRGDAMKAYCDATYAAKSHSHNNYLPLAGGVMPGNITIHNSNPYLCLMGAASGTAYVQTVEDTSGMQIGLGYGWAKSLKVDVNGNTTMVNDATINGDLTVNNTTDGATFLWIGSASRFHASGNYLYLYAGTGETAYRFGNGAPEVQVNGSYVKCSLEGHTHSGYVTTSGNAASATKASYPTGFSGNGGNITWGTLAGDTSTTTGYRTIARWDSPNGGSVAFADGPMNDGTRSGQTSMQIDGYFYQNEGRYMVLDTSNYSSYALPKSGGTLTGALTFANGTWNTVGDDVQIGDQNVAGTLCIKGTNGATAIQFTPYDSNAVTAKIVSNAVSSYGGLRVTGLKGGYHGILFGDDNTGLHIMSCDPHQGLYNQSTGRWAFYYNRTYDHVSIGGAATADSNYLLDVYGTTRIQGDLYATGTLHAESSIYEGGTLLSSKYASLATANTYNGEQKFQNSSYCPTVTDTASGVGCAFKASRGMANELLVDKLIMTATTGKIPFYKYTGTSSGAMTGLTEVASISSSGAFTTTGGAQITGRYTGSGDDEGLIVGFASNGYAGVCLGSASGKRSVFYLTSGGFPFWRYNDGSASYDITHPGKAGTIALTSDVEAAVAGSHTHSYLPLSGGTVSGTISTNALEVTGTRILCLPVYNNTVSYAANMYVGTNGGFGRANSTSSRTIKHDIRELTDDDLRAEKLYDLNVVQFKYNDGIITDTSDVRYGKTLPGFIIEDMDEKYPIAIDKPGQDVKEWSWNEKYLIPPILKLIQDQHKEDLRLDAELNNVKSELKSVSMKYNAALMKIAELEKRIDQLELAS